MTADPLGHRPPTARSHAVDELITRESSDATVLAEDALGLVVQLEVTQSTVKSRRCSWAARM